MSVKPIFLRAVWRDMLLVEALVVYLFIYYSAPVGSGVLRSVFLSVCLCLCACLSASMSLESLDRSSRNLLCKSPVAGARSSCGGIAMRYVLPVLWVE